MNKPIKIENAAEYITFSVPGKRDIWRKRNQVTTGPGCDQSEPKVGYSIQRVPMNETGGSLIWIAEGTIVIPNM